MTQVAGAQSRIERRRQETLAKLLRAAESVFAERGYDGATLNEITDAADLGIGTFYNYFPDKRAIYNALIRRHFLVMHERWRKRLDRKMAVEEQLAASVRASVECVQERPRLWRLFLVEGPPMGEEDFFGLQREVAKEFRRRLTEGESKPLAGIDLDALTLIIMQVSIGLGRWLLSASPPADPQKVTDEVVAFLVRGMLSERQREAS